MLSGSALDGVSMPRLTSWSFEKAYPRPQTTESVESSPNLSNLNDNDIIAVNPPRGRPIPPKIITNDASLQDKYLSSEEDLSPIGSDFSSVFVLEEDDVQYETATVVRAPIEIPKKSVARIVSYISVGRPKMVQVSSSPPRRQRPRHRPQSRPQSFTPENASMRSEYSTPPSSFSSSPVSQNGARSPLSEFSGWEQLQQRSATKKSFESKRISTVSMTSDIYNTYTHDGRYPIAAHSQAQTSKTSVGFRSKSISSPISPDPSSFLNTDPFGPDSRSSASPTIQSGKRLRSFTRTITLARAMSKRRDHQSNHYSPASPLTPYTPLTPLSPGDRIPPVPQLTRPRPKMVARAANERAPPIELPPFPAEDLLYHDNGSHLKLRKRKSILNLY